MLRKPIIIVPGQIKSVFFEIFFKSIKAKKINSPIILICNVDYLKTEAKRFKFYHNFKILNTINKKTLFSKNSINILNIPIKKNKNKEIQLKYYNDYISNCFQKAFKIINNKISNKFLNGPINKKKFLSKKYLGITEYVAKKMKRRAVGMLIYNKDLSVCPLTTHLPVKFIAKKITKKLINKRLKMINDFYLTNFKIKPKIGVAGLNPHCESISKYNEDEKIISPAIKFSKKNGISVTGPYSADTIFLKQNRKKFNVILGMYHDQVLTPLKALYEYDAINITIGLPFLRVSPDHGPNEQMVNKNLSNPTSLIKALEFLDKN